jgi:arylsulfatase A-like enzyme
MTTDSPNIVLIMTDNQPADAMGCYGNDEIYTPNLDALAADGIRFNNAYCPNAMCSPSRASVWSGRMPCQHGVHTWLDDRLMDQWPEDWNAIREFQTLPEILKDNGYATAMIGKYHLGRLEKPQNGIDHWITMARGHTLDFYGNEMRVNDKTFIHDGHSVDFFSDKAVEYIGDRSNSPDQPFLLMLPYNGPYGHWPSIMGPAQNQFWERYEDMPMTSVPREGINKKAIEIFQLTTAYLSKKKGGPDFSSLLQMPNDLTTLRNYYSQVSVIDHGVGQVMSALKENGFNDNTIVIYTADHGFSLGHHGFWGHGQATWPSNAHRIAYNIPLLMSGAGISGERSCDSYVNSTDLYATLLDRLGLWEDMEKQDIPSRSFDSLLNGNDDGWTDEVFIEQEETRAIRTPAWSYFKRFSGSETYPLENELYDLTNDPDERYNLSGRKEYDSNEKELSDRIDAFFKTFADPKFDLWNGGTAKSNTSRPWLWKDAWGEDWQPVT